MRSGVHLIVLLVLGSALTSPVAAQPAGPIRGPEGLRRDLQRTRRTMLPEDWEYVRLPEIPLRWQQDGPRRRSFRADLGNGWTISGSTGPVRRAGLDGAEGLLELRVRPSEARSHDGQGGCLLLPDTAWPVLVSQSRSACRADGLVLWKQPGSNLDLFRLLHELGHAADVEGAWGQRYGAEIFRAAGLVDRRQPITDTQRRLFVSTERRAWAHALLAVRSFRRLGIDLFPDIPQKTLLELAHSDLKSHLLRAMSCPLATEP